jgi:tetratricopeptide (TPR) repeat protein
MALEAAATAAQRAQIALTRLRYRDAARLFSRAAARVPPGHDQQRRDYLDRQAYALYRQGNEKGDNTAIGEAIRAYRDLVTQRPRERVPLDWAMTQNNLGTALSTLGERESGTARLEEASVCIANAWGVYKDAEIGQYDEYFRRRLEETKKLIDAR